MTNLDRAARYMQRLQGDAIWERTSDLGKERYREQVREVLRMTGRYDHAEPEEVDEEDLDKAEERYEKYVEPK